MRRRPGHPESVESKRSRGVEQYSTPLEVPTSYSMDDYPWSPDFIRDQFVRECNGDPEVARTVQDMIGMGYWFELVGPAVVLMGNASKASDDLFLRMHEHRVGIREWYLENAHGGLEAA